MCSFIMAETCSLKTFESSADYIQRQKQIQRNVYRNKAFIHITECNKCFIFMTNPCSFILWNTKKIILSTWSACWKVFIPNLVAFFSRWGLLVVIEMIQLVVQLLSTDEGHKMVLKAPENLQ